MDDAKVYWAPGAERLLAWQAFRRCVLQLKYEERNARRNAGRAKNRAAKSKLWVAGCHLDRPTGVVWHSPGCPALQEEEQLERLDR